MRYITLSSPLLKRLALFPGCIYRKKVSSLSGKPPLFSQNPQLRILILIFFHPSFTKTKHGTGDGNIQNCTTNPIYSG